MADLQVEWIDRGREPQCPPNPDYPDGIDVDGTKAGEKSCYTALPYPAKRCGYYKVSCPTCGLVVAVTTAGRPDDPRSVKVPCLWRGRQH